MNKTELLLKMLDCPDEYTQEQWQEILADDECRELYSMLAMTQSAMEAENADRQATDEMIAHEWQRLATTRQPKGIVVPLWRKIAAAAAIVVAFCGITFAAMHTGFFGLTQSPQQAQVNPADNNATMESVATPREEQPVDSIVAVQPHLYDDVPLEQILTDLAAYYHVDVEYTTEDVRSLRLYYQWEPDYTIDKVVEMLDNFQAFEIHREGDKLVVEQTDAQEGK